MLSDSSAYSCAEWMDRSNMWCNAYIEFKQMCISSISLMELNESERALRAPPMAFVSVLLEVASPPDLKFSS